MPLKAIRLRLFAYLRTGLHMYTLADLAFAAPVLGGGMLVAASLSLLKSPDHPSKPAATGEHADADLKAGPVEYRIPWQYYPSVTRYNPKNGYAAFTLAMLLPDFRGAALDHDEFARTGWHNQLTALFESNRPRTLPDRWIQENSLDGQSSSNDNAGHISGCKSYLGKKWLSLSDDLFVCDQKRAEGQAIVILCAKPSWVPYPDCEVSTNINSILAVDYAYSRIYMSRALEIDDYIRNITNSFTVPLK